MIAQIIIYYQCVSNRCNHFIIRVIRDFWAFSEISFKQLSLEIFSYPVETIFAKNHSHKGGDIKNSILNQWVKEF